MSAPFGRLSVDVYSISNLHRPIPCLKGSWWSKITNTNARIRFLCRLRSSAVFLELCQLRVKFSESLLYVLLARNTDEFLLIRLSISISVRQRIKFVCYRKDPSNRYTQNRAKNTSSKKGFFFKAVKRLLAEAIDNSKAATRRLHSINYLGHIWSSITATPSKNNGTNTLGVWQTPVVNKLLFAACWRPILLTGCATGAPVCCEYFFSEPQSQFFPSVRLLTCVNRVMAVFDPSAISTTVADVQLFASQHSPRAYYWIF